MGRALFVLACLVLAAYALYAASYFAWLAATPLTPGQQKRVFFNYAAWLTTFVVASIAAFVAIAMAIRDRRRSLRGRA